MGDGARGTARFEVHDVLKRVTVSVAGETMADSIAAKVLTEGDLPPRFYLLRADVRMDLLTRTATSTRCPWKGEAEYWSLTVGDETHCDIAWSYSRPIPEAADIAGLVCFFNERVTLDIAAG